MMIGNIVLALMDYFSNGKRILVFIVLLGAFIAGISSVIITKRNANPVEEIAEKVIELELGLPDNSVNFDLPEYKNEN